MPSSISRARKVKPSQPWENVAREYEAKIDSLEYDLCNVRHRLLLAQNEFDEMRQLVIQLVDAYQNDDRPNKDEALLELVRLVRFAKV